MKKLTLAMAFVCISLVSLLYVIGIFYNDSMKNYNNLESDMIEAASLYIDYGKTITGNKISMDELNANGYEIDNKVKDDTCTGYVLIKDNIKRDYKAYLKCENYMTEGYKG